MSFFSSGQDVFSYVPAAVFALIIMGISCVPLHSMFRCRKEVANEQVAKWRAQRRERTNTAGEVA